MERLSTLRRLIETSLKTEQFGETYKKAREVLKPYEEEIQRWANLAVEGKLGGREKWAFWKNCYRWSVFKGEEEKGVYAIDLRLVDGVLCRAAGFRTGTETVQINLGREGQIKKVFLGQPRHAVYGLDGKALDISMSSESLMDVRLLFPDSFDDTWVADRRFSRQQPIVIEEPGKLIPTVFPSAGYKIQEISFFIRPEGMRLTTKSNYYNGRKNEAKVGPDGELNPLCRASFPEILEIAMKHFFLLRNRQN